MAISAELKSLISSLGFTEEKFKTLKKIEKFSKKEMEDLEYMQDRIETAIDWEREIEF